MMTTTGQTTAVGVFDDRESAERAVQELRAIGLAESDIGLADRVATPGGDPGPEEMSPWARIGVAGGLVAGAGALAVWGAAWAVMFYPSVTTAAIGAGLAGLVAIAGLVVAAQELFRGARTVGRRSAAGLPGDMRPGQAVVTVRAGGRQDEAAAVLRRHGAHELGTSRTAA